MKNVLLIILMTLTSIGVQAQRQKCTLCRGTGNYSRHGGYTHTQQYMGTCPSCNKTVDLFNHHCKCGRCNGTGYYQSGSSSSRHPNPSKPSGVNTGDSPDIVKQAAFVLNCLNSNTVPTWETCRTCNGSGVCRVCNGSGRRYDPYLGTMPCMACSGLARCSTCMGGKMYGYTRPMTAADRKKFQDWMQWYIYKGY